MGSGRRSLVPPQREAPASLPTLFLPHQGLPTCCPSDVFVGQPGVNRQGCSTQGDGPGDQAPEHTCNPLTAHARRCRRSAADAYVSSHDERTCPPDSDLAPQERSLLKAAAQGKLLHQGVKARHSPHHKPVCDFSLGSPSSR